MMEIRVLYGSLHNPCCKTKLCLTFEKFRIFEKFLIANSFEYVRLLCSNFMKFRTFGKFDKNLLIKVEESL